MILTILLNFMHYSLTLAEPYNKAMMPNRVHPMQQPMTPEMSNIHLDVQKGHNNQFKNDVAWNLPTFAEFIKNTPQAKEQLDTILVNYGIISPTNGDALLSNTTVPKPEYIKKTLSEALAIHASFKEFLRKLFERVHQYLTQSSLMIVEVVIKLERKHHQLTQTIENYNNAHSDILKTSYAKSLFDIKQEAIELMEKYKELKRWKNSVEKSIEESL